MTNAEIESCIQTLRFLENTFLDDHGIFLNDKHPDNIEKIITFLHESPCEDCISQEAVEKITWEEPSYDDALNVLTEVRDKVRALPTVTPSRPRGRWICHRDYCESLGVKPSGLGAYEWCSNCDCGIDVNEFHRNHYNFCPNCGADMREGAE